MKVTNKVPVELLREYEEVNREDKEGFANIVYSKGQHYYHISIPLVNGKLQGNAEMVCVGRVVASLSYKHNQINGECILYHENGQLMEKVQVVNGWKKGRYTLYNYDGKAIETGFYTNDRTEFHTRSSLDNESDNDNEQDNRQRRDSPEDNMKKYTKTALIASGLIIAARMILRSRL